MLIHDDIPQGRCHGLESAARASRARARASMRAGIRARYRGTESETRENRAGLGIGPPVVILTILVKRVYRYHTILCD